MAASSPRSIQQPFLVSNSASSHPKSIHSSPNSAATCPQSSHSELEDVSLDLSRCPTSSSHPPAPVDSAALKKLRSIAIPLTDELPTLHPIVNPSSPVSVSNTAHVDHHVHTNSVHRLWISALLATRFYGPCSKHPNLRKNDLNLFCTTHAVKICQYCLQTSHCDSKSPCTILHVSRYMYHDVLLAKESAPLFDVSEVQSYLNNGNRVVYIDRRAQPKSKLAPHAKACEVCSRTLQDPYRFCSVFCRLAHEKDPAAVATLPVPDATPLVMQSPRKAKVTPQQAASGQIRKTDRLVKRCDGETESHTSTPSPRSPNQRKVQDTTNLVLPVRTVLTKKKHRRKSYPLRSPQSSPERMALFHLG